MSQCRACGGAVDLHLLAGELYCLACLPLEQMTLAQQVEVLRRRHQAAMEASQERREAGEQR